MPIMRISCAWVVLGALAIAAAAAAGLLALNMNIHCCVVCAEFCCLMLAVVAAVLFVTQADGATVVAGLITAKGSITVR